MFPQTIGMYMILIITKTAGMWDDYMPMIVMLPSYPSVASGAFNIQYSVEAGVSETMKIAALFLLSTPIMLVTLGMRNVVKNAMANAGAAIKG